MADNHTERLEEKVTLTPPPPPRRVVEGGTPIYSSYAHHNSVEAMLPKPIPSLTQKQWEYLVQRLDQPAPEEMRRILKEAIENSKKLKRK